MSTIFEPEDFLQKIKQIEEKKKKRTILILSIMILGLLIYILSTLFLFKKQEEKNLTTITKLEKKINQDSIAKRVIIDFFEAQNNNDSISILNLLSDTLSRYYLIRNQISKSDLKTNKDFEINKNGKYRIDSNFAISNFQDTLNAIVKSPSFNGDKSWNTIHEIKLNSSNKIVYVRAYVISDSVKKKFGLK